MKLSKVLDGHNKEDLRVKVMSKFSPNNYITFSPNTHDIKRDIDVFDFSTQIIDKKVYFTCCTFEPLDNVVVCKTSV